MDHNRRRAAWVVLAVVVLQLSMTSAVHAAPRDATVSAPTVEEPPATHLLSVALGLGLAFGGDELPNRGMNAGEGVSASVGAASAPFWVSWLGFGAGIDFGFKHASARAARADYALARWPLALHADVLARVSPQTSVRIGAGPYLELGVEIGASGDDAGSDRRLPHALGWLLEGGVRGHVGSGFALDGALRWTSLSYEDSARSDAGGLGICLAIHYVFL